MANYAYVSEVRLNIAGAGNPFQYQFTHQAFDSSGLVIWGNSSLGMTIDSTTFVNDRTLLYGNIKSEVISDVFLNTGITIPADNVYFIGVPDTFTFPDVVHTQSDGNVLLGGAFIFLCAMATIMFYFKRK